MYKTLKRPFLLRTLMTLIGTDYAPHLFNGDGTIWNNSTSQQTMRENLLFQATGIAPMP